MLFMYMSMLLAYPPGYSPINEELTKTDKKEIKTLISKELDKVLKSEVKKILEDELSKALRSKASKEEIGAVSYTHLPLPTIYSV